MKVRYAAADDLETILAYLHEKSPQAASGFLRQLDDIERLLNEFPWGGVVTRREWLPRIPFRHYPYVLFYEIRADDVMVLAIRHGARDPASMPDA